MRFNEIIENQLEIDDEVIEEYIKNLEENNIDIESCTIDDFIDFVTERYYIDDFVEMTDASYDIKKNYFLDEINRVKEQMNND